MVIKFLFDITVVNSIEKCPIIVYVLMIIGKMYSLFNTKSVHSCTGRVKVKVHELNELKLTTSIFTVTNLSFYWHNNHEMWTYKSQYDMSPKYGHLMSMTTSKQPHCCYIYIFVQIIVIQSVKLNIKTSAFVHAIIYLPVVNCAVEKHIDRTLVSITVYKFKMFVIWRQQCIMTFHFQHLEIWSLN